MSGTGAEPLVLATGNPDKVAELRALLGGGYEILPRPADLAETIEDGETLAANAEKKARDVVDHTGRPAVADDTGLFVAALDGRPGVRTGRFAGPDASYDENVDKLLSELEGLDGPEARRAEFRTVITALWPDGRRVDVEGAVAGWICPERRGSRGFGYDPVFVPTEGDGRSFAEMSADEKNDLSHRARAVEAFVAELRRLRR